jgi:hypothetical protein
MRIQSFLTAAAINLKRLAALFACLYPLQQQRLRLCRPAPYFFSARSELNLWLQLELGVRARHAKSRLLQQLHIAALIGRLCQNLAQRRSEAGVIVRHDKLDTVQTTPLQRRQQIPPARAALAIGELDGQHLATVYILTKGSGDLRHHPYTMTIRFSGVC